jgi:dipeptidyl aminopeptidase/acylaminoacyl peptidase
LSQHRRKLIPEDLYKFTTLNDAQITPDGETIAFVQTKIDQESKEGRSTIWLVPAIGGQAVQFTRSAKSDDTPRWSPDGRTLAFVSDRSGDRQIWLIDRFGGEARQLTTMRHGAGGPVWAPDSKRLAFTSSVGPADKRDRIARLKGDDDKKTEEKLAKDEARVFTVMAWRSNATGILPERKSQIWVIDLPKVDEAVGAPTQVTWGDYNHATPQWSPDGQQLAFSAKRSDDESLHINDIFLTDLPTADSHAVRAALAPIGAGAEPPKEEEAKALAEACTLAAAAAEKAFTCRNLTDGTGFYSSPVFAPGGETIAILGHRNEFENATLPQIWLYPVAGGEPRALDHWDLNLDETVGADLRPSTGGVDMTWAPDANVIYVPVSERGACSVYGFPVVGGRPVQVAGGRRDIASGSFDRNCETLAFIAGDLFNVSDLYVMDCREFAEERLTNINEQLVAEIEWPEVEELRFKARDGWDLHGWLMKPVGYVAGERYPLVLEIHGGPHTCYGHAFYTEFHVLAAAGYGVLFINPRGSTSYGQAFVDAVRGDYGGKDFTDLMDAVDHALTKGWADEKRLIITGGSYGGFMTNWAVTHTDRFAAAITHRSICNWVSFAGTPDFGPFFNIMQHKVDDPWSAEGTEALWQISPLKYVKNVKTPLSIMHSEFDYRCPIEQAEQFYMAIKFYGQAPTELIRHPRSNHDLTRQGPPVLRVDRFHKILKWFGRFVPVNA